MRLRYTLALVLLAALGLLAQTTLWPAANTQVEHTPQNYTPGASPNLEGHLEGIDDALGSAGGGVPGLVSGVGDERTLLYSFSTTFPQGFTREDFEHRYVSAQATGWWPVGSDAADGLTQETAWRSWCEVQKQLAPFKEGSTPSASNYIVWFDPADTWSWTADGRAVWGCDQAVDFPSDALEEGQLFEFPPCTDTSKPCIMLLGADMTGKQKPTMDCTGSGNTSVTPNTAPTGFIKQDVVDGASWGATGNMIFQTCPGTPALGGDVVYNNGRHWDFGIECYNITGSSNQCVTAHNANGAETVSLNMVAEVGDNAQWAGDCLGFQNPYYICNGPTPGLIGNYDNEPWAPIAGNAILVSDRRLLIDNSNPGGQSSFLRTGETEWSAVIGPHMEFTGTNTGQKIVWRPGCRVGADSQCDTRTGNVHSSYLAYTSSFVPASFPTVRGISHDSNQPMFGNIFSFGNTFVRSTLAYLANANQAVPAPWAVQSRCDHMVLAGWTGEKDNIRTNVSAVDTIAIDIQNGGYDSSTRTDPGPFRHINRHATPAEWEAAADPTLLGTPIAWTDAGSTDYDGADPSAGNDDPGQCNSSLCRDKCVTDQQIVLPAGLQPAFAWWFGDTLHTWHFNQDLQQDYGKPGWF